MGTYRKIAPSIMKKASAESDTTSKLYDVRENINEANRYVKQSGKFTKSSEMSGYTGQLYSLLNLEKDVAEKEEKDYNSAIAALEMLSGWRFQGKDWPDIMGIRGIAGQSGVGSSYGDFGTLKEGLD